MKTKITKLLIFASSGAILYTMPMASADETRLKANSQLNQSDASLEFRTSIDEPAGADLRAESKLRRASDLMGTEVRSQENEKIGDVKDVMVDLQSGQVPFAVVSSGGFFGVGERLMAIPISSFSHASDDESLLLSMDKEKLGSAPNFEANNWPNMNDQTWSSEVYSFYGSPARSAEMAPGSSASQSDFASTDINEPAGAQTPSKRYSGSAAQRFGETETGLSRDRTPRQGLGAEDLTKNEQKIYNPGGYAESDAFIRSEAAGAERSPATKTRIQTEPRRDLRSSTTHAATMQTGKVRRASELIGMRVENAQGEKVGDVKDVVLDLESGRVAYTVVSAGGFIGMGDRLYAVPPSVFTRSTDEQTLIFNTDKETLKRAPSFDEQNWEQSNNQTFTSEVYRYYHQQPYWQTSGDIRDPSGSQRMQQQQAPNQKDSSSEWQKGYRNTEQFESRPELRDPAGTQQSPDSELQPDQSGAQLNEPSGAEPERDVDPVDDRPLNPPTSEESEIPNQTESSAAKEAAELEAADANQNPAQEPAGATSATRPATSDDQAQSDSDRTLSQRLRTVLQTDAAFSDAAQNVQVSAANGRLTLRGTVSSEQEKKSIGSKAEEIAGSADKVDNQLRVQPQSNTP